MKCPHCLVEFHPEAINHHLGQDAVNTWEIAQYTCSACKRFVLYLQRYKGGHLLNPPFVDEVMVYPKTISRAQLSPHVPAQFADDYKKACIILPDSPKASAALSRRCLQHVLRDKAGIKHGNLANEIQQVLDSGKLPSHLSDSLDAIRNIGNFAAHPMKSQSTGEILDVEPGEAEWNLDVLESLFDFYFVQPEILKEKQKALNAKLKKAGKPPMK